MAAGLAAEASDMSAYSMAHQEVTRSGVSVTNPMFADSDQLQASSLSSPVGEAEAGDPLLRAASHNPLFDAPSSTSSELSVTDAATATTTATAAAADGYGHHPAGDSHRPLPAAAGPV
jgi:hypothetical protein